jgi:hypothetical protein
MQRRSNPSDLPPDWLDWVSRQVAAIRYGFVQIVVHEGRVVQVEKTERLRTDSQDWKHSSTGSVRASTGQPEN